MVEGGKGGSKEEEREEENERRRRGRKEGEGKGEWRKRKKGRGQCSHEPYIHIISKRQLRTGNYTPTTYICT